MRHFILLLTNSLILCGMVACVSTNKTRENVAIYDFGLPDSIENNQQITSEVLIEVPSAAESLNNNKIRYRLNYQNPSRTFFYTESRWASTPPELFLNRLSMMVNWAQNPTNCSLKLKIEAFDHVFQTAVVSEGVVQLSAQLIEKKSRKVISSQLISESSVSPSPNAKGGIAALREASVAALKKAITWANTTAEESAICN